MGAELWGKYVAWLAAHAAASHANLAPPASESQISEVERVTGATLPDDLKAVWRLNNGQKTSLTASRTTPATVCIPTLTFLSTELVIEIWSEWANLKVDAELQSCGSSAAPGMVQPLYTHRSWIPLWSYPTGADYVGLDLAPGETGAVGQIINFGRDEEKHFVFADSFANLLEILLEEVTSGAWPASQLDLDNQTIPWLGPPDASLFNALHARFEQRYPQPKPPMTLAQQVRASLDEGETALRASELARAKACVEQVHSLVSDGSLSYDLLTRILIAEGDLAGAQRELDALMARKPKYPGNEKLRGMLARAVSRRDAGGD
jgi:cell wall assembly regulator SMI1